MLETMKMNFINTLLASTILFPLVGCSKEDVSLTSMKCEYVNAGEEAVIYGKGFNAEDEVYFSHSLKAEIVKSKSNDSVLTVIVPEGAVPGKLAYVTKKGKKVFSNFVFRDNRGIIVDFDDRLATWGGYDPIDEEGEPITFVRGDQDSIYKLPTTPPEAISGHYGLLYGVYSEAWTMKKETFLQYCANVDDGGRGNVSVAGDNAVKPISELCLKFEVFVPKECAFQCRPRVEIFFGPYQSVNKHGREMSPICAWEPCGSDLEGFYTDGWQTISIPLKEFKHSYESDALEIGPINLKTATNMSFVLIGDPGKTPTENFMCVDNFRIVPIK